MIPVSVALWLAKNKTTVRVIAGLVLVVAVLGAWLYIKDLRQNLKDAEVARDAAQSSLNQCVKDQKTAYEVSNEYQNALTDTRNQLANLKRLRGSGCVIPQRKPASGPNASAGLVVDADAHGRGVSTDWLYDFAGECEGYRLQVIGLQSFITKTRQ